MEIHQIRDLVKMDFDAVNQLIYERIQSEVSLIDDLANHIIRSGGKRLRPLMVLLMAHAFEYKGSHHITLAAMIEFLHTATLLHDDVIDESTMRRGRETANEIWGSKVSILVGDLLLTQHMRLLLDVGNLDIMRFLTDVAYQVGCGEVQQLDNRYKPNLTESSYFEVVKSKTSLLFAASATIAGMLCHVDKTVEKNLYDYGIHLGNAFQLIDDTLDYCSNQETLGKNIGDDLADGVLTLPLIYALKHGNPSQREKIRISIQNGTIEFLSEIQEAIEQTRAVDYTRQIAKDEVDKAITTLHILPNSVYKEALVGLAWYAINRDH